jgi:hypothetical protein
MYLVLAILFALLVFRPALGLLPRARPRFWPSRITGLKNVRLSKFSLVSIVCLCFGSAVAFTGAAFTADTFGFIGLFISVVGFILVGVARSRDIRFVRRQRLAALTS